VYETLDESTHTCLVCRFRDKVTSDEYQQFLDAVNERINTSQKINLVVLLSNFDFYGDFSSARKDFKFAFDEYKHIRRAAFVGDQMWIDWFTRLIGPFTRAEEKHFADGELEAAFEWASE
jgi:hypothetical protein